MLVPKVVAKASNLRRSSPIDCHHGVYMGTSNAAPCHYVCHIYGCSTWQRSAAAFEPLECDAPNSWTPPTSIGRTKQWRTGTRHGRRWPCHGCFSWHGMQRCGLRTPIRFLIRRFGPTAWWQSTPTTSTPSRKARMRWQASSVEPASCPIRQRHGACMMSVALSPRGRRPAIR